MDKFECFGPEFQDRILACWIAHPKEFAPLNGLLKECYFKGIERYDVARAFRTYYEKYERCPPWDILLTAAQEKSRASDENFSKLEEYVDRLKEIDTSDTEYVVEQSINFFKVRTFVNTLNDAKKDFDEHTKPIQVLMCDAIRSLDDGLIIGHHEPSKSFIDYAESKIDPDDCLLGDRFLCREGACLIPAPTGVGKSSTINQMTAAWSCGRNAFGIKPSKPLKILVIQAEDDKGDMKEMAEGIINGLKFTDEERSMIRQNAIFERECSLTGDEFIVRLRQLVRSHRPDIVVLNPLNAYIGGKGVNDAETVTRFCRNQLNPILIKYRCANITVHHTAKPSKDKNTENWRPSDWVYAYAGSNELANWCRAMIVIDPTHDGRIFRFIGAKRGSRLGWQDDMDEPSSICYFAHAKQGIYWSEATEEEIQATEVKGEEKRRGRNGRPKTYDNNRLLKPLQNGKRLIMAEWLEELNDLGCKIARTTLKERAQELEDLGEVCTNKSKEWFIEPKECAV